MLRGPHQAHNTLFPRHTMFYRINFRKCCSSKIRELLSHKCSCWSRELELEDSSRIFHLQTLFPSIYCSFVVLLLEGLKIAFYSIPLYVDTVKSRSTSRSFATSSYMCTIRFPLWRTGYTYSDHGVQCSSSPAVNLARCYFQRITFALSRHLLIMRLSE